jgi:hypothetical protein
MHLLAPTRILLSRYPRFVVEWTFSSSVCVLVSCVSSKAKKGSKAKTNKQEKVSGIVVSLHLLSRDVCERDPIKKEKK